MFRGRAEAKFRDCVSVRLGLGLGLGLALGLVFWLVLRLGFLLVLGLR